MKLSMYRSKQKKKCRRLIRFVNAKKSKKIGRPQKRKSPWFQNKVQEKKTKFKIATLKEENVENTDTAINNEQDISNISEDSSNPLMNPDCLPSKNVIFDEITHSLDDNENEDFKDQCFKEISNEIFLKTLINILFTNNCLQDFMLLIRQIVDGSLPVTNIAFLLCLERAK